MSVDPRFVRPAWRGRTNVDALTIAAIERAENIGGHQFVVTQGSYQSTVAASAGTHDGGGAVDLRWCGHDSCLLALRKAGLWAWHRNPSQGPWPDHIHAVVVDHPLLAPDAAAQIESARRGRNGLKGDGPDDGPRTPVVEPIFPWPPPPEPTPWQKAKGHIRKAIKQIKHSERPAMQKQKARLRKVLKNSPER